MIPAALSVLQADIVVNAAAFTAVDLAESQSELAFAINHRGAEAVAAAAASLKIPVVQLSTDYVFDGTLDRPYVETDPVNAMNVYGQSKLAGEQAVASAQADHVILRTAWIYSPFGKNFVRTMLSLADQRPEVSVVADQLGAPTSALDIADSILECGPAIARKAKCTGAQGSFSYDGRRRRVMGRFRGRNFCRKQGNGRPGRTCRSHPDLRLSNSGRPASKLSPRLQQACCNLWSSSPAMAAIVARLRPASSSGKAGLSEEFALCFPEILSRGTGR